MSKKNFLTKVMAGVALGAAALLASAPSATIASDWGYGGFDKDFGHHEKFKETGYISGIAVAVPLDLLELELSSFIRVTQVCSKPQSSQPVAKVFLNGLDQDFVAIPLELQFPTADHLFRDLFFLEKEVDRLAEFKKKAAFDHHGKFDHHKKFDHDDKKFDHHDKKFDHHDKKFDHKGGTFFVYEGTAQITDLDILDLLQDAETLFVKGSCATGVIDVVTLDLLDIVENGVEL